MFLQIGVTMVYGTLHPWKLVAADGGIMFVGHSSEYLRGLRDGLMQAEHIDLEYYDPSEWRIEENR